MSAEAGLRADPDVRAAGGIVRRTPTRLEVLVVHRPRYDDWTFPKGKRDDTDVDDLATALREVAEETGFTCTPEREIGSTRYRDHRGRDKIVRYWLMDLATGTSGDVFEPNREVDEILWCRTGKARSLLTYEHDRALVTHVEEPSR